MYNYLIHGVYGNEFKVDFVFHYVEEKEEKNRVKPFAYEANPGYEEWLLKIWNQIQDGNFIGVVQMRDVCITGKG